jgi:hypothetical protein
VFFEKEDILDSFLSKECVAYCGRSILAMVSRAVTGATKTAAMKLRLPRQEKRGVCEMGEIRGWFRTGQGKIGKAVAAKGGRMF